MPSALGGEVGKSHIGYKFASNTLFLKIILHYEYGNQHFLSRVKSHLKK